MKPDIPFVVGEQPPVMLVEVPAPEVAVFTAGAMEGADTECWRGTKSEGGGGGASCGGGGITTADLVVVVLLCVEAAAAAVVLVPLADGSRDASSLVPVWHLRLCSGGGGHFGGSSRGRSGLVGDRGPLGEEGQALAEA